MHFIVRNTTYIVSISRAPLFHKGQPCKARIDPQRRKIWLSDQLGRSERRRSLMHELVHAWRFANGMPLSAEVDADQTAELMDELGRQFDEQGGNDALESLDPETENVRPNRVSPMLSGPMAQTSISCGYCKCNIGIGSVDNGKPEWSADASSYLMERGMHCESCGFVTLWTEACSESGMPLGAWVAYPPPRIVRGKDATNWIRSHAELCNVIV